MKFKNLLDSAKFTRFLLAVWLASSVITGFLLYEIDMIVENELYKYGLNFNPEWTSGYLVFMRLMYASIAVPALLSALALVSVLRKKDESKPHPTPKNDEKKNLSHKGRSREEDQVLISCPKCRKVFSKPLVVLDFSHGKTKLVNVCPYCDRALSSVDKTEESNIHITTGKETLQDHEDASLENE